MVGNTHSSEFPVAFLSLGPGDSELLTIKAVRILRDADVVMVPTSTQSSRAAEIISEWCDADRIETFCVPMRRNREAAMKVYDEMFERVATLYHQGLRVVVAVEGDVSIYASVHEVLERLKRAELPVIQLAGIPSFIAAAAKAGLSLCSQQQRLVVLPGDADVEGLKQLLTNHHVVVVMKLSQCQQEVKAFLQQHMDIECHYFENVGTTDEFYTTEHVAILGRTMPYFSLCILYSN
ncbi:MAG: precorrin-2 C(20)-methyltransferase [Prevotella sp.]|nr:precorrin-2 C(20)-methyltransferase [Prevotella sp.]MBR1880531.1 precorrin-2 C(20)-methyltransferase [Prevotella sp.]